MKKTLKRIVSLLCAAFVFYAAVSFVGTLSLLANAADRLYQGAGQPLFWLLLVASTALVLYPLWLLQRLPHAHTPPEGDEGEAAAAYHEWLRRHLRRHPSAEVQALAGEDKLAEALAVLGAQADALIRQSAAQIFVSTAVLQNGRLDGLVMLGVQMRLVWRLALLYRLRPTPSQMWYLYSNVAGTVMLASNLDEINFAELTSPLVHMAAPSFVGAVPGMQAIGNLLVHSLANGSANAFLTLRVGLIAKAYCAPLHAPQAQAVRQSATLAALGMLSAIAKEQGSRVSQAVWNGVRGTMGQAADSVVNTARHATSATTGAVRSLVQGTWQAGRGAVQSTTRLFGSGRETPPEQAAPD